MNQVPKTFRKTPDFSGQGTYRGRDVIVYIYFTSRGYREFPFAQTGVH
jgi:hypothetical protein